MVSPKKRSEEMKYKFIKPIISVGLISVMLMGCGTANDDRFANDNNNDNRPMGVRYNPDNNRSNDFSTGNRGDRVTGDQVTDGQVTDDRRGAFGVSDSIDNINRTGHSEGSGMSNQRDDNQNLDVADDVAEKVAAMEEVDRANVLVTNRNAYVAVMLNDENDNLTNKVEKKIAKQVRDINKNIDNVYVSENPNFYDRMQGYGNDIREGRPISGFFDEFTETVQRIFPTAR